MVSGSPPYISLEKECQVSHSNNILLNLETIFWIENQKLVSHVWSTGKDLAHQLHDDYRILYTDKSLLRIKVEIT